jgi:hypothetical protein
MFRSKNCDGFFGDEIGCSTVNYYAVAETFKKLPAILRGLNSSYVECYGGGLSVTILEAVSTKVRAFKSSQRSQAKGPNSESQAHCS